jgi:AAA domain
MPPVTRLPYSIRNRMIGAKPSSNGKHLTPLAKVLEAAAKVDQPRPAVKVEAPAADIRPKQRAAGRLLSFLEHDTPERQALLKAAGIDPADFLPRYVASLGEAVLESADLQHAEEVMAVAYDLYYHRLPKPDDPEPPKHGLITRRLSEVIERQMDWLWWQRFPRGYLSLVSGDPDLGKSWLILDILARITTGRSLPDGSPNPFARTDGYQVGPGFPRRQVLWVSAEDADEDVIKPRFRMLGGDHTRLHTLDLVRELVETKKGSNQLKERESSLDLSKHLDHLDNWLRDHPLVVAVALDPFSAFLGKTNSHTNSDVRALLTPLYKLSHRRGVAIIGNNHLNKGEVDNAMYRSMGSIAFVAAARSSWLVTKDPKQPEDRRLFTKVKCNPQTENVGGLAFRVGPSVGGFFWEEGRVDTTADEALRIPERDTKAPAKADAKDMLRELLKDGPVLSDDVWARVDADRMCHSTIKAAARDLGVQRKKTGGSGAPWAWSLPRPKAP